MKKSAMIAVAAVLWICAAPSNLGRADGPIKAAAASDERSSRVVSKRGNRAERWWIKRQREQRLRVMKKADREAIVWGNESKPNGTIVRKLDPPLKKSRGPDVVEVELFSAGVDDDGFAQTDCRARELALGVWWPSIEMAGVPVFLDYRQVDQGPGLDSRYLESRRSIGELVVGGAWYASNGDERGLEVVRSTIMWLRQGSPPQDMTSTDVNEILIGAGIDRRKWTQETRNKVEAARMRDNARWEHFAVQYLEWLRSEAKYMTPLGRGSSPILIVDGTYLVTTNTIWRQGGLQGTERLFQTVNSLIRQRLEANRSRQVGTGKNENQEEKMNYTAAILTAAIAVGMSACVPAVQEGQVPSAKQSFAKWAKQGVRVAGFAEVTPDAAHVRFLESGEIMYLVGLEPLEGEEAEQAQRFLNESIKGKSVWCWMYRKQAKEGDPRAGTAEGRPIASCTVRKQAASACKTGKCHLTEMALENGYGRFKGGAWETRSSNASKWPAIWTAAEGEAREAGKGIWGR